MKPEIRELPERTALCVTRKGMTGGTFTNAATEAFGAINTFVKSRDLGGSIANCVGICPDDPSVFPLEDCRYQAGFIFKDDVEPEGEVERVTIPGGRWAVFTHVGPYDTLSESWRAAYGQWIPASGHHVRGIAPYEVYLKGEEDGGEPVTEIHIAVE